MQTLFFFTDHHSFKDNFYRCHLGIEPVIILLPNARSFRI